MVFDHRRLQSKIMIEIKLFILLVFLFIVLFEIIIIIVWGSYIWYIGFWGMFSY